MCIRDRSSAIRFCHAITSVYAVTTGTNCAVHYPCANDPHLVAQEIHRVSARGVTPGVPLKESRRALVFKGFNSVLLEYRNAACTRCVALFRPEACGRRLGSGGGILPHRSPRISRQSVIIFRKLDSGPHGKRSASAAGS